MQCNVAAEDLTFDLEIERTLKANQKAAWLAHTHSEASTSEEKETLDEKNMDEINPPPPPRRTVGTTVREQIDNRRLLGLYLPTQSTLT
jgi:hypothetical protein